MAKKKDRLPPFVPLVWELLNSRAYINLSPSAAKALPYFLGKVKLKWHHPDKYTDIFTFSYPEGRRLGFSYGTFARAKNDLIEHGFIILVEKGGLRGNRKGYNKFTLSKRWKDYNPEDGHLVKGQRPTSKKNPLDIVNYGIPCKNGNKNGAKKAPITPNLETKKKKRRYLQLDFFSEL